MNKKYWLIKIVSMIAALLGILWLMADLRKDDQKFSDPNSPVGALLGVDGSTTTTVPEPTTESIEDKVIPARVKTN